MEKYRILAHRGWWLTAKEKNSLIALNRAIEHGFGIETDFRDYNGKLVISHDPVGWGNEQFVDVKDWLNQLPIEYGYIGVNVKSDGLSSLISDLFEQYNIQRFFVFDMSVPETIRYASVKVPYFVRQSEMEKEPIVEPIGLSIANGIWLDSFTDDNWYDTELVTNWLDKGFYVSLVSPELHGREHQNIWKKILHSGVYKHPRFMICTDLPMDAMNYF